MADEVEQVDGGQQAPEQPGGDPNPTGGGKAKAGGDKKTAEQPKPTPKATGGRASLSVDEEDVAPPAPEAEGDPNATAEPGAGSGEIHDLFEGNVEQATIASQILNALLEDPQTAYAELGQLLGIEPGGDDPFGDEQLGLDGDDLGDEGLGDEQDDPRAAWIDQQMQAQREAQEDQQFEHVMAQARQQIESLGLQYNEELFVRVLFSEQGNPQSAIEAYKRLAPPAQAQPTAPPTLGGGPPAPRQASQPKSIGDAFDQYMNEERARRG